MRETWPGATQPHQLRLSSTGRAISRRALLRGGLGVVAGVSLGALVACSEPASSDATAPPADPLLPIVVGHRRLVELYDSAAQQAPSLGARLTPLAAQATAHRDALEAALPATVARADDLAAEESTGAGPTVTQSPERPDPSSELPTAPPADPPTVLAELRLAVSVTRVRLRAAALTAQGDLAALFGSVAAATACHERLLR